MGKLIQPQYNLFQTVIYQVEDQAGGFRVGRIESIYSVQDSWRYGFHDGNSCFELCIMEAIKEG